MEPNNFQENIQNKFSKREINPSPEAWDRLDAMLTVAEKKEKKMPWLKIAASFLLVGMIGFFIIQNQKETEQNGNTNNNNQTIVNQNSEETNVILEENNTVDSVKTESGPQNFMNSSSTNSNSKTNKVYKKLSPAEKAIMPKEKEFENKILQDRKRNSETKLAENKTNTKQESISIVEEKTIIAENNTSKEKTNNYDNIDTSFKIKVATINDYEGEKLNLKITSKQEKELNPNMKKKAWDKIKTISTAIAERNYEE